MNNKYYTVCGIVEIEGKVLLVRHTYGNAKQNFTAGWVCSGK